MLFEDLLLLALALVSFFMIILPLYKFITAFLIKPKKDPRKEARMRLEAAKAECEAARLNKEAEALYEKLYQEALEDESVEEVEEHLKRKL